MKLPRRKLLHLAAGAAALPLLPRVALALDLSGAAGAYSSRISPSSGPDIVARLMGQRLSERLQQQFIVENRPGAGGYIAARMSSSACRRLHAACGRAARTQSTRRFTRTSISISSATLCRSRSSAARPLSWQSIQEFQRKQSLSSSPMPRLIRARSIWHLPVSAVRQPSVYELFKMMTGVDLVHVPYRASFLADLIGGQVQAHFQP